MPQNKDSRNSLRRAKKNLSQQPLTEIATQEQTEKTFKKRKQKWEGKQLYVFLKQQSGEIAQERTKTRKVTLKREIEYLLITAQITP